VNRRTTNPTLHGPSGFYGATVWKLGLGLGRIIPSGLLRWFCVGVAEIYYHVNSGRRQVVEANLRPLVDGDRRLAAQKARWVFREFAQKMADLWQFEAGVSIEDWFIQSDGWEHFETVRQRNQGALLIIPHLGNWEIGGPLLARRGVTLCVVTQSEPGQSLTELRSQSRARWGIETVVVGNQGFEFIELINRLQNGGTVAMLIDRPGSTQGVEVTLFGRPFRASLAPAELARATGCALIGTYIVRRQEGYQACFLPEIGYDRQGLRNLEARQELMQRILRAMEPAIRQYADQWFHFIPIWPTTDSGGKV
jgi:lauroyl/myristoyl acyltransferase